jgi:AsmA protein
MKRKLRRWGLSAAVVATAIAAAWLLIAPRWAVPLVEREVSRALGRTVTVASGAHLEVAPELAVRLDDVVVAAPAGMDAFVTARSVRVPIGLAELLSRSLDLSKLALTDAHVELAIDELGQESWPAASGSSVALEIENASLRFSDRRSGQFFALAEAEMAVAVSAEGELALSGSAVIAGQPATIEAHVKNIARVSAEGSPAELSLAAPPLRLNFAGRLVTSGILGLAGTLSLEGPDLRQALRWAGSAPGGGLGLKAFTLAGALDSSGQVFAVKNAEAALDGIAAKGELSMDFRTKPARLRAVLATGEIDIGRYVPAAGGTGGGWGTADLGFEALRGIDVGANLAVQNLVWGGFKSGPGKVSARLSGGRLDADIAAGDAARINVTLDGSGALAGLALSVSNGSAALLGPLAGATWLAGQGEMRAELSATGRTQEEMIATLRGEARVALGEGALHGLDVAMALAAVSRAIQDGWPSEGAGKTPFTSANAEFAIADGIAGLKALRLESPDLTLSATGEIDLLRRALDLKADPRLSTGKDGGMAGLPVAVVVSGPWARPRIHPDMAGILGDPDAAYAKLRALGLPQSSN